MKTTFLNIIMIAILVLSTNTIYATLKRLNNNFGIVADYTSIDAALNGQATWDTLYVEPSLTSYNLIGNTISMNFQGSSFMAGYLNAANKVMIGNGYFLDNGTINYTPPSLQSNKYNSRIGAAIPGQITPYVTVGNNVTCIGLTFETLVHQQTTQIGHLMQNINFVSCLLTQGMRFAAPAPSGTISQINNIKIRKCYIDGIIFYNGGFLSGYNFNNFTLENNIILGTTYSIYMLSPSAVSNTLIRNNVISKGYTFKEAYCANNIFLEPNYINFDFTDNNLKNNIFVSSSYGLTNPANSVNNQFNVSDTSLFNPFAQVLTGNPEAAYYLKPGVSPAIGAGVPNGAIPVDCGAFGGPDPYKLSGIPPFPTIYELSVPAVIPAGTQMNITLSTRSNN